MSKVVAHYEYVHPGDFHKLVRVYKLLAETDDEVLVKHWYGKRWHPKNTYWRIGTIKTIKTNHITEVRGSIQ